MTLPAIAVLVLLMVTTVRAEATPACVATSGLTSGPYTLPLVELYTSEGCDSCPPADRWLSATFPADGATASVLAFHVDYWDHLGWKDRFASPDYTARQYASMRATGAKFVYTPQVLVQGRDVETSRRAAAVQAARTRPARATIALEAPAAGGDVRVHASVTDRALRRDAALWIAYTESALVSVVAAGENRGKELRHDHVVRALHGPYAVDDAGEAKAAFGVVTPKERGRSGALVAFVQNRQTGDVLQSVTLRCGA